MSYLNAVDNTEPLVTIGLPTYNRIEFLRKSVESILLQNYSNIELIISDNASTDGTAEYLDSLVDSRVKIIKHNCNVGMVGNWQTCLNEASGEYFLLMSDDDYFFDAAALSSLVEPFLCENEEEVGFVFSNVILNRGGVLSKNPVNSSIERYSPLQLVKDYFSLRVSIFPCATLLRRKDLISVGGYSEFNVELAVDACVWILIASRYTYVHNANSAGIVYRIHNSLSSSAPGIWEKDLTYIRDKLISKVVNGNEEERIGIQNYINKCIKRGYLAFLVRQVRYNFNLNFFAGYVFNNYKVLFCKDNLNFLLSKLFSKFKVMN